MKNDEPLILFIIYGLLLRYFIFFQKKWEHFKITRKRNVDNDSNKSIKLIIFIKKIIISIK